MKKTFPIQVPDKVTDRVVESIKGEVRKYLKRERRKKIPEGFDQWDFACKVGPEQIAAETKTVDDVFPAVDAVAKSGSPKVYIEVLSAAGKRFPSAVTPAAAVSSDSNTPPDSAAI